MSTADLSPSLNDRVQPRDREYSDLSLGEQQAIRRILKSLARVMEVRLWEASVAVVFGSPVPDPDVYNIVTECGASIDSSKGGRDTSVVTFSTDNDTDRNT